MPSHRVVLDLPIRYSSAAAVVDKCLGGVDKLGDITKGDTVVIALGRTGPNVSGRVAACRDVVAVVRRRRKRDRGNCDETEVECKVVSTYVAFESPVDFNFNRQSELLPRALTPAGIPTSVQYNFKLPSDDRATSGALNQLISSGKLRSNDISQEAFLQNPRPIAPPSHLDFRQEFLSPDELRTVDKLLKDRCVWAADELHHALCASGFSRREIARYAIRTSTFTITGGPFAKYRIAYGYDPTTERSAAQHQRMAFRLPSNIRHTVETIAAVPELQLFFKGEATTRLVSHFIKNLVGARVVIRICPSDVDQSDELARILSSGELPKFHPSTGWYSRQAQAAFCTSFCSRYCSWITEDVLPRVSHLLARSKLPQSIVPDEPILTDESPSRENSEPVATELDWGVVDDDFLL